MGLADSEKVLSIIRARISRNYRLMVAATASHLSAFIHEVSSRDSPTHRLLHCLALWSELQPRNIRTKIAVQASCLSVLSHKLFSVLLNTRCHRTNLHSTPAIRWYKRHAEHAVESQDPQVLQKRQAPVRRFQSFKQESG